jgi:oligosaccharyltransferase complex subunit alpha (ribophorin I)
VEVITPFAVDHIYHSVHKTYLDSTGRYVVTLSKTRCTENHGETIYVSEESVYLVPVLISRQVTYTYPLTAQLQKPVTVAAVVGGLFILAMGLRRVDYRIDK